MKLLKGLKHFGHGVGKVIEAPFKGVGKVVHTVHKDVKGIFKGAYSMGKDISGGIGTGLKQITSPIGLISIAAIIAFGIYMSKRDS